MFGEVESYGRTLGHSEYRVQVSQHVNMREAAMEPERMMGYVQNIAMRQMADLAVRARVKRIEHDFNVEFKCDLYVFSPSEFHHIVETAARELEQRYSVMQPPITSPSGHTVSPFTTVERQKIHDTMQLLSRTIDTPDGQVTVDTLDIAVVLDALRKVL